MRRRAPHAAAEQPPGDADGVASVSPPPPPDASIAAKPPAFGDTLSLWIYRYNLSTALYMLEPWERALFNCVVLSVLAYIVYGLYYSALHPLFERFAESYM